MNRVARGKISKAKALCTVDRIARHRVRQIALSIWVAALAAWLALSPIPASASQAVNLSAAIPDVASIAAWDTSALPLPDASSRAEPEPKIPAKDYLPDLRTLPMTELRLQPLPGGWRFIRLANTIWNSGQGPLELIGEFNADTNQTRVHQQIYTSTDSQRRILVGEFVWHPTHDHWHMGQFTLYELWALNPDLSLGSIVASSDKLSYCAMDTDPVDLGHPRFSLRRGYVGCGQYKQGLSVGWGDTYQSFLDGQSLDVTGLPDGYYALISAVNPDGLILEENYANNAARAYLELRGDRMTVVTLKHIKMTQCDESLCK